MDQGRLQDLLTQQQGVVARRQVVGLGGTDNDIERMIRRRAWPRVHTGVYVAHNGPMTPQQRTWAALLRYWPAALAGCQPCTRTAWASARPLTGSRSPWTRIAGSIGWRASGSTA